MTIGELAKATGLNPKTIRFYEAGGLLRAPARTSSGYRLYNATDVTRLQFILKAKRLGLSLEEVGGILRLHDRSEPTCVHVRSLIDEKLAQVDRVLKDLREFRAEIVGLRERAGSLVDCRPSGGRICGIIERGDARASDGTLAWVGGRRAGRANREGGPASLPEGKYPMRGTDKKSRRSP